jgi:hypothetical protein
MRVEDRVVPAFVTLSFLIYGCRSKRIKNREGTWVKEYLPPILERRANFRAGLLVFNVLNHSNEAAPVTS